MKALREKFEHRFYALHLRDDTTAKVDLWQTAGEDTLQGQFLALLQEKLHSASEEEKAIYTMAAQLGLAAMEGREEGGL